MTLENKVIAAMEAAEIIMKNADMTNETKLILLYDELCALGEDISVYHQKTS